MAEMNVDQAVDIPDTPDRLGARHINSVQLGNESNSSIVGHLKKSEFMDEECLNRNRRLHNRRLHLHSRRNPIHVDEFKPLNKSIALSSPESSHPSSPLFRRAAIVNNPKPEAKHSIGAQNMDKRKSECAKIRFKTPVPVEDTALFNRFKDLRDEEIKEGQTSSNGGSSSQVAPVSSATSSNAFKGKEKLGVYSCTASGSAINHGKGINQSGGSQQQIEKQMAASHISVTSPRVTGQKRLVRNGFISPHNIASRAQKLVESIQGGSSGGEKLPPRNMVSDGSSPVDIREIVSEDNNCHRAKGKGLIIHHLSSRESDANIIPVSTSNSASNNEAANETSDACEDASLGGWRSTHSQAKKINHPFCDLDRHFGEDDDARCFVKAQQETRVAKTDNGSARERHRVRNALSKRQKKHGLSSRNNGEWSTMSPDGSEILFLGSSGESSSARSSSVQNRQHQGILDPVYEIDELSPEMRDRNAQVGSLTSEDSEAKARQVEADEILARELQEQLYREVPIFEVGEIDENIAWALQQEEDAPPASFTQNHSALHLGSSSIRRSHRQPQQRSSQNPSNRRGTQVQVPATRVSHLRNHFFNRAPMALSRGRNRSYAALSRGLNFHFPLDMDLDMRLDILAELETTLTAGRFLQFHDDFNENDYEMLLALDENNPQHGASTNLINSLPESVVHTNNPEETCAICLEAPSTGETIRHLPCLHKFHKDCIDPWLSRRTTCPVCKSSIT